jgi:hypothetical protein
LYLNTTEAAKELRRFFLLPFVGAAAFIMAQTIRFGDTDCDGRRASTGSGGVDALAIVFEKRHYRPSDGWRDEGVSTHP